MGTVAYMSPEQVRGEELDPRTDIFSCGVVLYEMATSTLPFPGATTGIMFNSILNRAPTPATAFNPAMPAEVNRILDKALEKDRDLRYQSARELRADLARLRRDSGSARSLAAVTPAPVPPSSRWRRRAIVAGAGLGLIGLAVAGYFAWPRRAAATPDAPRALSRLTFEDGLQTQPTWAPDGRFVAYASDQAGNFDIWVQPIAGGRAVQVTTHAATDWQPVWSPDGNTLAFRSERDGGGIFVVPALGGRERRLTTFGYRPEWSPKTSELLFVARSPADSSNITPPVYLVGLDGAAPKRILSDVLAGFQWVDRITWHPDGERISFRGGQPQDRWPSVFWTVPLAGGAPVRAEVSDTVTRNLKKASLFPRGQRWAPAGDALYLEGESEGVVNLWRIGVDPKTLRWVSGPERITTGLGTDGEIVPSPDGRKLAFVTRTDMSRLWSLPFDAAARRVTAEAQPVTSPTMSVQSFDLSADGRWLAYVVRRTGKSNTELRVRSFEKGTETLLGEAPEHAFPRVSRDGSLVAYRLAHHLDPWDPRLSWMARTGGEEHTLPQGIYNPWDWSGDGARILHGCPPLADWAALCSSPRDATTTADTRTIVAPDPEHFFWQGRFSPDGRWVVFNAQPAVAGVSVIGVVPASGGKWTTMTTITAATLWADKPRWSPDGRTIYFVSNRNSAFFGVWGRRFDPDSGRPIGDEFRVTRLDSPSPTVDGSGGAELSVSATRILMSIRESKGSVWLLDEVPRKQ